MSAKTDAGRFLDLLAAALTAKWSHEDRDLRGAVRYLRETRDLAQQLADRLDRKQEGDAS